MGILNSKQIEDQDLISQSELLNIMKNLIKLPHFQVKDLPGFREKPNTNYLNPANLKGAFYTGELLQSSLILIDKILNLNTNYQNLSFPLTYAGNMFLRREAKRDKNLLDIFINVDDFLNSQNKIVNKKINLITGNLPILPKKNSKYFKNILNFDEDDSFNSENGGKTLLRQGTSYRNVNVKNIESPDKRRSIKMMSSLTIRKEKNNKFDSSRSIFKILGNDQTLNEKQSERKINFQLNQSEMRSVYGDERQRKLNQSLNKSKIREFKSNLLEVKQVNRKNNSAVPFKNREKSNKNKKPDHTRIVSLISNQSKLKSNLIFNEKKRVKTKQLSSVNQRNMGSRIENKSDLKGNKQKITKYLKIDLREIDGVNKEEEFLFLVKKLNSPRVTKFMKPEELEIKLGLKSAYHKMKTLEIQNKNKLSLRNSLNGQKIKIEEIQKNHENLTDRYQNIFPKYKINFDALKFKLPIEKTIKELRESNKFLFENTEEDRTLTERIKSIRTDAIFQE